MSDDPLYREIILEHWQNPQNYGVIDDADVDASGNNPLCGDKIRITAKIRDGKLSNVAFTAEGCAISIASASLFTESVQGSTLYRVKGISKQDVLDHLGITLTPSRTKCALLPLQTLLNKL